nr:MAG TPA: hypothetical protein [Caudoviricetes sp.]
MQKSCNRRVQFTCVIMQHNEVMRSGGSSSARPCTDWK